MAIYKHVPGGKDIRLDGGENSVGSGMLTFASKEDYLAAKEAGDVPDKSIVGWKAINEQGYEILTFKNLEGNVRGDSPLYRISNNISDDLPSDYKNQYDTVRVVIYNKEIHFLGVDNIKSHYKWDNINKKWIEVSILPDNTRHPAFLVDNYGQGRLHMFSGYNHYRFNNNNSEWTLFSTLPYNFNGGVAVYNDNYETLNSEIHILGGWEYSSGNIVNKHYMSINKGTTWEEVSTIPSNIQIGYHIQGYVGFPGNVISLFDLSEGFMEEIGEYGNNVLFAFPKDGDGVYKFNANEKAWNFICKYPDELNKKHVTVSRITDSTAYISGGYIFNANDKTFTRVKGIGIEDDDSDIRAFYAITSSTYGDLYRITTNGNASNSFFQKWNGYNWMSKYIGHNQESWIEINAPGVTEDHIAFISIDDIDNNIQPISITTKDKIYIPYTNYGRYDNIIIPQIICIKIK